jgi:serine protease Do
VQVPVGGDIISAIDGQPIANFKEFTVYLETQKLVGETIEATIIRDGAEQIITLTLEARPEQR